MKRIITLLLSFMLVFSLYLCGGTESVFADNWTGTGTGRLTNADNSITVTYEDVVLSKEVFEYTGSAITPNITISDLSKDVDYAIAYKNNINPGIGKITIVGIGNFTGTITRTFKIAQNIGKQVAYKGDIVLFGSYPQTEIVAEPEQSGTYGKTWESEGDYEVNNVLYDQLNNASWTNNETTIGEEKYRRIKRSDATSTYDTSAQSWDTQNRIENHYT